MPDRPFEDDYRNWEDLMRHELGHNYPYEARKFVILHIPYYRKDVSVGSGNSTHEYVTMFWSDRNWKLKSAFEPYLFKPLPRLQIPIPDEVLGYGPSLVGCTMLDTKWMPKRLLLSLFAKGYGGGELNFRSASQRKSTLFRPKTCTSSPII